MRSYNHIGTKTELERKLVNYWKTISKQFPEFFKYKDDVFLAGGAIASVQQCDTVNDYDFWFKSEDKLKQFLSEVEGNKNIKIHPNSLTVNGIYPSLNIITRTAGLPEEIIKVFDFQHTMNYYDQGNLIIKYPDLVGKRTLIFNPLCQNPLRALERIHSKFRGRGYKMGSVEFIKIAKALAKFDFDDLNVVKEQIRGMYITEEEMKNLYDSDFLNSLEKLI